MRTVYVAVAAAVVCAACGQTPVQPAPATEAIAATPAAPATPASPAAAPVQSTAPGKAVAASRSKAVPSKYHMVERNGTKYYCTDEPQLGTRLKSRSTCMTAEQFERAQQEAQDEMREKAGQRWQVE